MAFPTILKNFIVFEGIDGSGTTTQIKHLLAYCEDNHIKAFATREPTSSPIGKVIDSVLKRDISFSPQTIIRLFATDRCEHIYGRGGIIEMLEEGIDTFIEIGPGKTLSGFLKRIETNKEIKILNISNVETYKNTLSILKGE